MAEDINLTLEPREVTGKQVKKLRRDGFVPAVIHDHGKPSIHVMGDYLSISKAYRQAGRHHMIALKVGGKNYTAIIKKADFEPRKHQITHVVFGAVQANEKVTAEIPIKLSEDIPAERASLMVITQLDALEVEALPKDLPDEILVDASSLVEIGDKLTVADIKISANVTVLTEPEHSIATVYEPSAVAAANDAAGGDAEAGDESEVESEHESSAEEGTQGEEIRPGGKQEKEDKQQGHNPAKD